MPFRVEVWNRERTRNEETLAASSSLPVARGANLAGIKAQIGYKRQPGSHGSKPSLVVDIEPVNATGSSEPARAQPAV